MPIGQNRPLVALQALRALARNPDDLPKVFDVIASLPGRSRARMLRRMRRSPDGARLLAARPDLARRLSDRAALSALPAGTLGRAYAEMTEENGISPQGIVAASAEGAAWSARPSDALRFLDDRMRDTHDLWHVVTGYGVDVLGELGVLAFSYAQTRHPGVALILGLSWVKGVPRAREVIEDAHRRGARAAWLPAVPWEELLDHPLDDVRLRLGVGAPPPYVPVTTADLRAAGRVRAAA